MQPRARSNTRDQNGKEKEHGHRWTPFAAPTETLIRHKLFQRLRNKGVPAAAGLVGREIGARLIRIAKTVRWLRQGGSHFWTANLRYKLDRKWLFTSSGPLVDVRVPVPLIGHPVTRSNPAFVRPASHPCSVALFSTLQPPPSPVASVSPLSLGALCLYSHWFARQCLLEDLFQYFQLKLDKAVFDNACVFRRSSCEGKNNVVRANDQEWFSAVSLHRGGTFQAVSSVCVENISSMGERTAIAKQSSVYTEYEIFASGLGRQSAFLLNRAIKFPGVCLIWYFVSKQMIVSCWTFDWMIFFLWK